ncbi:MAG: hypothetical protein RQ847_03390 [Wenzhouxiangellaceae bacterium]|nr:hypothetical protein [Wenzhouxiangellaceae bacterium]
MNRVTFRAAPKRPGREVQVMKRVTMSALAVFLLSSVAATAQDQASDRAAILAVIDKAFAAVASGDPKDWRPLLTDQARSLDFVVEPDGTASPRERSFRDFLATLKPGDRRLFERWLGEPAVLIRGPIAVVWGEYDFWIDGKFSHCGVDTVNLGKFDGEWKIAHFMWTVESEGCETAADPFPGSLMD